MKEKPTPGTAEPQLGSFKNLETGKEPLKNAYLGLGDPRKEKEADLVVGGPWNNIPGRGWYTGGYLPHYDEGGALQMITYRLGDSLPQSVLEEMEETLVLQPEGRGESVRRQRIEEWLDAGQGSCVLGRPEAARCVVIPGGILTGSGMSWWPGW